ncbi:MAG: glycosyltransferase, partial [Lachnospiraceae bacterium]|nr:glycosyltransferase [Lachnospiraceae bacterium]
MNTSISVCIIAKNEEAHLPRCLDSLARYGFEIVVVDTGSTDRTKEIALEYGAKVYDFAWIHDFSAARNYAAEQASHNWILALDCDEYVTKMNLFEIRRLIKEFPRYVGTLEIENEMLGGEKRTYTTKLVRLYPKRHFHFVGEIHEQVYPLDERRLDDMCAFDIPLHLYHTGYVGTPEQVAAKNKRNIDLLMAALEKDPEDAYNYFQLGQSYVCADDYESACEWFGKALYFDLDETLEYVQTMVVSYGQSLLQ